MPTVSLKRTLVSDERKVDWGLLYGAHCRTHHERRPVAWAFISVSIPTTHFDINRLLLALRLSRLPPGPPFYLWLLFDFDGGSTLFFQSLFASCAMFNIHGCVLNKFVVYTTNEIKCF